MGHPELRRLLWLLLISSFSPQFPLLALSEVTRELEVSEGVGLGTRIGLIGEPIRGLSPPPPPYLIVPVPGSSVDSDLYIDQGSGEIRTRVPLDRESRDSYSFVAIPTNGENIRVVIRVRDENDNAPQFPTPFLSVEFPENTPRDVKRTLMPAMDKDLDIYTVQRYAVAGGNVNNAFRLSSHRERDGVLYLDLQVNGFLDRETTPFYNLVIDAFDGGIPPLKGSITVNVTIQDVNDNQPIFNQSRYFATVPENATVGTAVLQVFATDTDAGENGRIAYSINRRQTDKESIFKIDPSTGVISLNRPLDYEVKEVHELVVVARDNGLQPLETTVFVSIRVIDVNDNQAVVSLVFLTEDASPKISEAAQPGQFLARVTVYDPDSKQEYQNVKVSLEGGEGQLGLATRNGLVYLVVVAKGLDRETRPAYTLNLYARDELNPSINTSATFRILVSDVNDNRPEFEQPEYFTSVLEVADPGTSVIQVQALDADLGNNSQVTYELMETPGTHSHWFSIDPHSGLITTKAHIDCETEPMPRLTIVAFDSGSPVLSSSALVTVTVRDVNDNEPIFDHSFYNVSVPENTGIGKCILKVSASDPDCGINAIVNYTIREVSAKSLPLFVNSTTGEICVSGVLDFEERTLYEIPVVATDTGGLSSTTMVKIQVIDTNDNKPVFYPLKYNISLREGAGPTGPIVSVAASDRDSGRFGAIVYKIVSGNDGGLFTIDKDSGQFFVTRALGKTTRFYRLLISATDGSGLVSDKSAELTISVVDAKQQPPVFQQARYSFSVAEDVPLNFVIGTVSATGGGRVRYSISSGDPHSYFTIDNYSGVIKTGTRLDHEKHSFILLNIEATSEDPPAYSHCQVDIRISDVNDNGPEFEMQEVSIWVPENAEIGSVIYAAHATDPDQGEFGRVKYSLIDGPARTFSLDADGGQVRLLKSLDYENTKRYTLLIGARDSADPPRLAPNLTIFIEVQDVNDNAPVFQQTMFTVTVSESTLVGTHLTQVYADDEDTGNNARVSYSLADPEVGHLFGVFPNSGVLYLKGPLDREKVESYSVRVRATDHGAPPLSTLTTLSLRVSDENDNSPIFSAARFRFFVEENNVPGATVGLVTATDEDVGDNGGIRYSLQPPHNHFNIDPRSGLITASVSLDREKESLYELQVVAADEGREPQRQSEVLVEVNVMDMNDNSPEILEPDEDLLIVREDQPIGTEVTRIVASDPDNGVNSTLVFSLVDDGYSDSDDFSIDPKVGIVRTKTVLDHEKKPFYTLGIVVRDRGSRPLETLHEYRIEVLDLNDNRPTFSRSKFNFKVSENASIGHVVGTVTGREEEAGEPGRVTFIIIRGNTHEAFEIDKGTGTLLVAKELNYELTASYFLQVKAIDNGDLGLQSNFISIDIEVVDVNDERPQFAQDPVVFSVSEKARVGSELWNFTAHDPDDGLNGLLHYGILQQEPPGTFKINTLTGALSLLSPLDYEKQSSHVIVIVVSDQPADPADRLNATLTANILVEDQNDNAPVFTSASKISIFEVEPPGYAIHRVIAYDADSEENGRIRYKLMGGNEAATFSLDPDTGELSLSKAVDREEFDSFTLNISASDCGLLPLAAFQILHVSIEGISNSPPVFVYRKYEARVQENSGFGTEVVKVTAFDRDQNGNVSLVYIIPEGMGEGKFGIHPSTGSITVIGSIDREKKAEYLLTVYVYDAGHMSSFDTTTVLIRLTDVNDNAPNFKDSCVNLSVPENSELGIIHTLTALDADAGRNGEVSFTITAGNLDNMFSVDLHTGKLSSRPLDRERHSKYTLLITAQDQGIPSQRTSCNLTVYVTDENDNDPMFGQRSYAASIPENVGIGTTVLLVEASDADIGINSVIKYSLNNESHWHFTIDNATGAIVTAGLLDREKIPEYTFEVAATDGGLYDSRSSKAQVTISLTDVNDHRPQFTDNPILLKIPAFTKPGQNVTQLSATDADEGINADISFSIESSDTKFRVQRQTGVITPVLSLAAERGRIFQLQVVAKDGGVPPLSSTALVVIQVGDVDPTHMLRFQEAKYESAVYENSSPGTRVAQVVAVRNDGRRKKISYSIVGGNEDEIFDIVESSGVIEVRDGKLLDRERYSTFNLTVSGKTEESIPLYAHVSVHIRLLDANDNVPRFTQDSYIASVWEGNSKGAYVTQVTATDSDEGANANLIYHIIDGNHDNAFMIEPPFSGIVKTNIVLDREIQDKYRLTIIATDEGSPQNTGTCVLQINVIDINDNQPTFPPSSVINVSESVAVGSIVTTMMANDVDTNPSLVYAFTEDGNPEEMFHIGKYSGSLTLAKPLDYEEKKSYRVKIQVSDSVHTSFTSLTVNLVDANDNSPIFSEHIYHVTIPDDSKGGLEVLLVNASDGDSGRNAEIKYSLKGSKKGGGTGLWIDETTGMVYTNGSVSSQTDFPFSQFTVFASDSGEPKRTASTTLWIEVRPSDSDFLRFSRPRYTAEIGEDAKPGTVVQSLSVEYDKKLSKNLHFHYAIVAGNYNDFFTITRHSGKILVAKRLDRETAASFTLKVTADCVTVGKCNSTTEVFIKVRDVHENYPLFNASEFKVSVSENKPVGSTLLRLAAPDSDADNVIYDISSGNEEAVFELNSGILVLRKSLDFDRVSSYRFVVRAVDGKSPKFHALAVVHVVVQDENDNRPQFPIPLYMEFVGENEPIGTTVFTARANDLDKGIYGKLNYSILEGDGKDKFRIEPSTGVVTTETVFDYETKNRYYFTLRANDIGGQSSTVKVQIEIESRDEFPPQFTQKTYKYVVPSNAGPGHVIGFVKAVDEDGGPDGRVIYQMRQTNGNFRVNRTSGAIVVRGALSNELNSSIVILGNSGRPGSRSGVAIAEISIGPPSEELGMASSSGVSDWVVGLLVTSLLLLFIFCTVFAVLHVRHKRQNKSGKSETYNNSGFETLDYHAQSTMLASNSRPTSLYSPQYSDLADLAAANEVRRRANNTVSELSDQSHSASSGRGSAEDGEEVEDEEIRMINEGSMAQQKLRDSIGIPDSGIHGDDDVCSQGSAKNTQEYLARLGIRSNLEDLPQLSGSGQSKQDWGQLEKMLREEEGDISALIYSQIAEDEEPRLGLGGKKGDKLRASLPSIPPSEDEPCRWDYVLDWGPQYQPLAHVFSEIGRLKDDSSSEAHYSGIGGRKKGKAPRPGPLPPLPAALPRSPIGQDGFGPMCPSFSPALSPLANRSPSISPLGLRPALIRTSQVNSSQSYASSSDSEMRI